MTTLAIDIGGTKIAAAVCDENDAITHRWRVPTPMDADAINAVIDQAIAEAQEKGIHGKETTPFLLAKIKDLTGGDSLASNIQLVYNNARLAAQTAGELSRLVRG